MFIFFFLACEVQEETQQLTSPDGHLKVSFNESDSGITYAVSRDNQPVIEPSVLGLETQKSDFFRSLRVNDISDITTVEEAYMMHQGKRKNNSYMAHQQIVHASNATGEKLDIIFNLSNDGLAFRYRFPEKGERRKITNERTSFHMPPGSKAWLQPMSVAKTGWNQTNPSYEENYEMDIPVGTPAPTDAGWVYPALFKTGDTWILITESGLQENYCGTRLEQNSGGGIYKVGFPDPREVINEGPLNPESETPWVTPWRILAIGSPATFIESNLGNAVAEPAEITETDFIKPGLASWSWALLKDNSIKYDIQKEFIDYAAEMTWPYCLVDVNWDTTIGYEKISELSAYAQEKGVGLILWYNSAGDWNTVPYHPKDKMLTHEARQAEFSRLNEMGIKGIKVDFFGGDGQSVIKYYHELLRDAGEYEILVNFHGTTLPRGWHRTYPHLMTMESIKGFEFITFEQGNADLAPEHCALIPFTRNAFDPMDFTPMNLTSIPGIERRTSPAFELALPTLFLSGIQHIAETAEGMKTVPDYVQDYLKDIPVNWDETKFIAGNPGEYVIVARKKNDTWFVTGINATDEPIEISADFAFMKAAGGMLITNGENSPFVTETVSLNDGPLNIFIAPKGGIIMKLN